MTCTLLRHLAESRYGQLYPCYLIDSSVHDIRCVMRRVDKHCQYSDRDACAWSKRTPVAVVCLCSRSARKDPYLHTESKHMCQGCS